MADITIGIVASAREWRSVLQAHVRDHVAGVRVQILREPRMALELDLDVVVIDDVSSFLTRDKVVRLREKGTRVVGIYDPDGQEGLGIQFLENLGVDLTLPSNISPEEMINALSQLQPRENYSHTFDHVVSDYATQGISVPTGESTLIAVSGPAGTGSTEVAIALADILVARREATLLLDVDEVGPSVARRLGFHLHPNILSAIDTVNNVTRPLTEMVGRPSDRIANSVNFDVIPGIANPEDWSQLRSMDMEDLFTAVRKSWKYIVCNTGPFVEDLSGYGIERFGSSRSTIKNANVIIGVMSGTPTGYLRFLDWLATIRTIEQENPVYIVVNNVGKSSYIRGEIESQLIKDVDSRYIAGIFFLPSDDRVSKAEWEGQLVRKGQFVTALAEIASYVAPVKYSKRKKKASSSYTSSVPYSPDSSYPSGIAGSSQPGAVSWNDPDIVNPPQVQQGNIQDASLRAETSEGQIFFNSSYPNEQHDIENQIDNSMPTDKPISNSQQTNPYTFSPPLHNIESINSNTMNQQNATTESESQTQTQGYTPHFIDKKQEENGNENFWGDQ